MKSQRNSREEFKAEGKKFWAEIFKQEIAAIQYSFLSLLLIIIKMYSPPSKTRKYAGNSIIITPVFSWSGAYD